MSENVIVKYIYLLETIFGDICKIFTFVQIYSKHSKCVFFIIVKAINATILSCKCYNCNANINLL